MDYIALDIETRSPCDLKAEGGRRYAEHPGTEILTVAWIHGESRCVWFPGLTVMPPAGLLSTQLPGVEVYVGNQVNPVPPGPLVAHNAWGFDSHVWKAATGEDREWIDTEPLARACGLPGGIDKIGERLRGAGKHKEGKARLLKFCRADSKRPGVGDLCMIAKYNLDDVEILKLVYEYVAARPQTPTESRVLATHRRINDRGIRVDLKLCQQIATLSEIATARTVADIATATNGALGSLEDLRSRTKVFDWVRSQQASVGTSLRKDALETLFREHEDADTEDGDAEGIRLTPVVRRVLTQRFSALRITGAKVSAAMKAAYHGRLHDILVYYGAHTGRWAGRRVQPQNLPRPKPGVDPWAILETDLSAEAVLDCMSGTVAAMNASGDWKSGYAIPTLDDAISGLLRSIFIPDDGYFFAAADYNAIEARVLAWLAGEEKLLTSFREGTCPYLAMASKLYGEPITNKKDPRRQVGKVVVLGCGYQLGEMKMGLYALAQGIDLEAAGVTPSAAVNAYRDQFPEIAGAVTERGYRTGGLWNGLNYAAIKACLTGKGEYRQIAFRHDGRDLRMILPSGRALFYPSARVEDIVPAWGGTPKKSVVCKSTFGLDKVMYGGKWAENATQAVARDPLAEALVNAEAEGIFVPLHVHDEGVAQVSEQAEAKVFTEIMAQKSPWATGLPLSVECDTQPRYGKSAPKGWESYNAKS